MRVLAVSEDRRKLDDIRRLTADMDFVGDLVCHEGSLHGGSNLPVQGEVDALILDCSHGIGAPLADLEHLLAFFPGLNVILLVEQESPELLLRALRLGVREVLKAPLDGAEMLAAFQRIMHKSLMTSRGEGKVLAFMSCKGGSGASFIATNLAYVLAERSAKRVLLIDLNLQFGDAILYVSDRRPAVCLSDIVRDIQRLDMSLLQSAVIDVLPNYGLISAPEDPTSSIDIRPAHIQSLLRFARAHFDYVVLDVGRSLDTCTIAALDLADHIYPVLQLTLPFLRDAKRLFEVYRSLDYSVDKVRPILNRVERSPGDLTERDAEKILAYKIFATIPNHYKSVTASVNQGVPIRQLDASSPVTHGLQELADLIADIPSAQADRGLLSRLFGRA